jgi:hypothetical protein
MLKRNECVSLAMNEKCRAMNMLNEINVSKPFTDDILEEAASFVLDYMSD